MVHSKYLENEHGALKLWENWFCIHYNGPSLYGSKNLLSKLSNVQLCTALSFLKVTRYRKQHQKTQWAMLFNLAGNVTVISVTVIE